MQFLTHVTITGVDAFTDLATLSKISHEFPFVEWGVLLSKSKAGIENRFPNEVYIDKLLEHKLNFACHICGELAYDFILGGSEFISRYARWVMSFKRLQLNVANVIDHADRNAVLKTIKELKNMPRIIIQTRSVVPLWWPTDLMNCVDFLYDCSGGRGMLPSAWPSIELWPENEPLPNYGYAGGLSPDNLESQLVLMEKASGSQSVWIDVESGVRTNDILDLDKVRRFLTIAKPCVLDYYGAVNAEI